MLEQGSKNEVSWLAEGKWGWKRAENIPSRKNVCQGFETFPLWKFPLCTIFQKWEAKGFSRRRDTELEICK